MKTFLFSATGGCVLVAFAAGHCEAAPAPCSAGSGENSSKVRARQFAADSGLRELTVVNYRGTSPMNTPAEYAADVRKGDARLSALAKRFPLD